MFISHTIWTQVGSQWNESPLRPLVGKLPCWKLAPAIQLQRIDCWMLVLRLESQCWEMGVIKFYSLDSLAIAYSQGKHLEVAKNGTPKSSKIRAFQHWNLWFWAHSKKPMVLGSTFWGECVADGIAPLGGHVSSDTAESHQLQFRPEVLGIDRHRRRSVAFVPGLAPATAVPEFSQQCVGFDLYGSTGLGRSLGSLEIWTSGPWGPSFGRGEFYLAATCHGSQMGCEFATGWHATCCGYSWDFSGLCATWSNLGDCLATLEPRLARI